MVERGSQPSAPNDALSIAALATSTSVVLILIAARDGLLPADLTWQYVRPFEGVLALASVAAMLAVIQAYRGRLKDRFLIRFLIGLLGVALLAFLIATSMTE